jgi:hypothetical protein
MKDADHVYQPGIGDTVEQHVRANGQFSVSGADVVDGAAPPARLSQGPAGIADAKSVARGLVLAPVPSGVLPDLFEVGLEDTPSFRSQLALFFDEALKIERL